MRTSLKSSWHLLLLGAVFLSLFPLVWMSGAALKTQSQIFTEFLNPVPKPFTLENLFYVWNRIPVLRYFMNSLLVAATVTAAQVSTSLVAAYGFTQFRFPGRDFLFYFALATILVPVQVTMLPNYLLVADLGWLNTYQGLIVPQLANAFGIFLLRQAFRSVPASLIEAARVDGAGHWGVLRRVLIPSTRPSIVALSILTFINVWNEYFWPLLVGNDSRMLTLPLALQTFSNLEGGTSWGPMMAAALLTALPPLTAYLLAQRHVVESFLSTGLKG